jgi:glycosyltransferase involved in cell wall biosynthesis
MPMVSIGMPIYNAEKYLTKSLDSLLAQDFQDFELIISDNASTDSTEQICRTYASKDSRIRYSRNAVNEGAVKNFNRVFQLSSGRFFMWASDHDLWEQSFISECLRKLEEESNAVLCFSPITLIDKEGQMIGTYDENLDTTNLDMLGRFHTVIWRLRWKLGAGASIYGLINSEALRMARPYQNVYGPDWILLIELSLLGSFVKLSQPLFHLRDVHSKDRTAKNQWESLDPKNLNRPFKFPFGLMALNMLKGIFHAKVSWKAKPFLMADVVYSIHRKFGILTKLD